ncbi:hypothetical protein Q7C36_009212 [Tachysurus vachellii]|uniref:Uncharacterized protein n=1 Tax=Tachysurus vachellii TaxID=175792 RepID=A0AA88N2N1_TACVA|nr:hypothetical protein Q7C36_009212 [Tachysurus vachellii]
MSRSERGNVKEDEGEHTQMVSIRAGIASPLRYKNNDSPEHSRQRNPDVSSWRRRRLIRRLKGISSGTERRPKDASLCLTINHPLFPADRG